MNTGILMFSVTVYIPAHAGEQPGISDMWLHPKMDGFRVTVGAFGQATSWKVVPENLVRFQALNH